MGVCEMLLNFRLLLKEFCMGKEESLITKLENKYLIVEFSIQKKKKKLALVDPIGLDQDTG